MTTSPGLDTEVSSRSSPNHQLNTHFTYLFIFFYYNRLSRFNQRRVSFRTNVNIFQKYYSDFSELFGACEELVPLFDLRLSISWLIQLK